MREVDRTIPTCKEAKECEIKWAAARDWVINNAGWKLQHVTADYLETFNPTASSPNLAMRVVKEPKSDGSYQIKATAWCDNMFGCVPDGWEALKKFNDHVNGSWRAGT